MGEGEDDEPSDDRPVSYHHVTVTVTVIRAVVCMISRISWAYEYSFSGTYRIQYVSYTCTVLSMMYVYTVSRLCIIISYVCLCMNRGMLGNLCMISQSQSYAG